MNLIEVESGGYAISDIVDNCILYTLNLGRDIAFTLFSSTLRKVALARNLNDQQCINLLKEINPANLTDDGLFQIYIHGGDASAKCELYLWHLITFLDHADPDNIFYIKSLAPRSQMHPESFAMNCADGCFQEL